VQNSNFFLRTKLLPPRPVPEILHRPRLAERLAQNLSAPVTIIAADAGCGKTTLIADFIRSLERPVVWYQLDHTDTDPAVFLGYLAQGIRTAVPAFGETLVPYLAQAQEDLLQFPERAADLLVNEILESVEQPFVVVLDDYHHIGVDTVVHKILDRVLQYSSDLVHFIITTRDLPPLAMMRRRAQSAAMLITRDDLLFTDGEVRDLFQRTLNIELAEGDILEYRKRTEGWITALQLVRQVAERNTGADNSPVDLAEILRRSEKDIFDYFAEEVFSREPAETQDLLMRLALLETLPLDLCSHVFPDVRAAALLPKLANRNVFLTVAGDARSTEEYRFHPLFRQFLVRRMRSEYGKEAVSAERRRIAEYFLGQRKWEAALPYLLDAESFERAAKVIAETGGEWLAAGAFSALGSFADRVPDEFLDRHPRALLHLAEIARVGGETERSSVLLHRAAKLLREAGDTEGEAEALHSLASIARRQNRFDEAISLLEAAEGLVDENSETYLKCLNTRGLCRVLEGKWPEAEQQFRAALGLAERAANERYIRLITHNLALVPGLRGDFGEALRWFKRIFRDDASGKPLPQEAIGHLNVARLHLYRGEFEECERGLERSLELCQLYNLQFLRPEIFEAYGNFYRETSDFDRAAEFYERARAAYADAEIDVATKELDEERSIYLAKLGRRAEARKILEELVRARTARGKTAGVKTATLRMMQIDLAEGRVDGVAGTAADLVEFFHSQGHYYDEALAAMLLAEAHFVEGRHAKMLEPVQRAMDLSARFDYDHWLRGEMRRVPGLFLVEEVFERLPADYRELLQSEPSVEPVPAAIAAAPSITDLTVNALGPPEVFRDPSRPFAPDAWTTKRARDMFLYVATSRHRRVPKDALIDAFWPDDDLAAIEKNFHPTISHIRKALNSRQPLKQNFLVFRDGAYQLNPALTYSIDTEHFEQEIAAAETAKREREPKALRHHLEAAYGLYRGEFMSGIYDPWVDESRTYYAEQFARVVNALAKLSFSEKRWTQALKFATEILREDPFREDVHRLVLKIHAGHGKPASIKKHYEAMESLLRTELGITPSAETRKLYAELMK
jgi:ATP/maltotriose-dependent transcriptional regulator MalT/DNA-binding SARP family transcriptional activator